MNLKLQIILMENYLQKVASKTANRILQGHFKFLITFYYPIYNRECFIRIETQKSNI